MAPPSKPASRLPPPLWWSVGTVWTTCLLWAVYHERISARPYGGERFTHVTALNFVQSLVACGTALLALAWQKRSDWRGIPRAAYRHFAFVAFCHTVGSPIGYAALLYVDYPLVILATACKMLPIMVIGACMGRRYTRVDYGSVALMTMGVLLYSASKIYGKPAAGAAGGSPVLAADSRELVNTLIGMGLLMANLLFDGLVTNGQDALYQTYRVAPYTMMALLNGFGSAFLAVYLSVDAAWRGPLSTVVQCRGFVGRHPSLILHVIAFSACGALAQLAIYVAIRNLGSFSTSIVTIARKFGTIAISVAVFGHVLAPLQWAGVGAVLAGFIVQMALKDHGKWPQPRPRGASLDEKAGTGAAAAAMAGMMSGGDGLRKRAGSGVSNLHLSSPANGGGGSGGAGATAFAATSPTAVGGMRRRRRGSIGGGGGGDAHSSAVAASPPSLSASSLLHGAVSSASWLVGLQPSLSSALSSSSSSPPAKSAAASQGGASPGGGASISGGAGGTGTPNGGGTASGEGGTSTTSYTTGLRRRAGSRGAAARLPPPLPLHQSQEAARFRFDGATSSPSSYPSAGTPPVHTMGVDTSSSTAAPAATTAAIGGSATSREANNASSSEYADRFRSGGGGYSGHHTGGGLLSGAFFSGGALSPVQLALLGSSPLRTPSPLTLDYGGSGGADSGGGGGGAGRGSRDDDSDSGGDSSGVSLSPPRSRPGGSGGGSSSSKGGGRNGGGAGGAISFGARGGSGGRPSPLAGGSGRAAALRPVRLTSSATINSGIGGGVGGGIGGHSIEGRPPSVAPAPQSRSQAAAIAGGAGGPGNRGGAPPQPPLPSGNRLF